jgi:hypothetical protein
MIEESELVVKAGIGRVRVRVERDTPFEQVVARAAMVVHRRMPTTPKWCVVRQSGMWPTPGSFTIFMVA